MIFYRDLLRKVTAITKLLWVIVIVTGTFSCEIVDRLQKQGPTKLTLDSVSIWKIGTSGGSPFFHSKAINGDWAIKTPELTMIITGKKTSSHRRFLTGSIFAVETENVIIDSLVDAHIFVEQNETPVVWKETTIEPKIYNNKAGLHFRKVSEDDKLRMHIFFEPLPKTKIVKITARLINTSQENVAIKCGSELWWKDGDIFSPGIGFVKQAQTTKVSWVGMKGKNGSAATLIKPELESTMFSFNPEGRKGHQLLFSQQDLLPNTFYQGSQYLIFGAGGLENVAKEAWSTIGKKTGMIKGVLSVTQKWAEVWAKNPDDDSPVLVAIPDAVKGSFALPLPIGEYRIVLASLSGEASTDIIVSDEQVPHELTLEVPKPGLLNYKVVNKQNELIPTRLVIWGISGTKNPVLGPHYSADGAGNVVYSANGTGELYLPAGRYRILATHGPEYSIHQRNVHIAKDKGSNIKLILEKQVNSKGWLSADFHLHASPSPDSNISLKDRIISLLVEDVKIAVASDHNLVTDYSAALTQLGVSRDIFSIPGVEVTTWNPQWGHFNVWPWPIDMPPPSFSQQTAKQIFAEIRKAFPHAVIQANHPRMDQYNIGYFTIGELDSSNYTFLNPDVSMDFDTIEIWNGSELGKTDDRDKTIKDWFGFLNYGHKFAPIGGSDSHYLLYQWTGYPRTYVRLPNAEPDKVKAEDLIAAVKDGKTLVTNGPFVVSQIDYALPGDLITKIGGEINLKAEIQSSKWILPDTLEIVINGQTVHSQPIAMINSRRVTVSKKFSLSQDSWVSVIVRGAQSMDDALPFAKTSPFAITAPIFVDVDGNGSFDPPSPQDSLNNLYL